VAEGCDKRQTEEESWKLHHIAGLWQASRRCGKTRSEKKPLGGDRIL
jgi:hypothetical protein